MLLVDCYESEYMQEALKEVGTKTALPTGDYSFFAHDGISIGIENKELLGDFLTSLTSGRLADQCTRLSQEFDLALLMVRGPTYINEETGNLERRYWATEHGVRTLKKIDTGHRYTSVVLALLSLWRTLGVVPLYVENEEYLAKFIIALYRSYQEPREHGRWILDSRKRLPTISQEPIQESMLRGLPGIGTELAEDLLERFGTLKEMANADITELAEVPKIGKAKATLLYKAFNEQRTLADEDSNL